MKVSTLRSSAKPSDVGGYIAAAEPLARKRLREMRACLRKAAPKATESLKWNSPALAYDRILFTYAAFRHHVSLFPTPAVLRACRERLGQYRTTACSVQFPLDRPLPLALIRQLALARVKAVRENDARWM